MNGFSLFQFVFFFFWRNLKTNKIVGLVVIIILAPGGTLQRIKTLALVSILCTVWKFQITRTEPRYNLFSEQTSEINLLMLMK